MGNYHCTENLWFQPYEISQTQRFLEENYFNDNIIVVPNLFHFRVLDNKCFWPVQLFEENTLRWSFLSNNLLLEETIKYKNGLDIGHNRDAFEFDSQWLGIALGQLQCGHNVDPYAPCMYSGNGSEFGIPISTGEIKNIVGWLQQTDFIKDKIEENKNYSLYNLWNYYVAYL